MEEFVKKASFDSVQMTGSYCQYFLVIFCSTGACLFVRDNVLFSLTFLWLFINFSVALWYWTKNRTTKLKLSQQRFLALRYIQNLQQKKTPNLWTINVLIFSRQLYSIFWEKKELIIHLNKHKQTYIIPMSQYFLAKVSNRFKKVLLT